MDSILEGLNAAQHDAVTSPANVLQVLAPPGSGKTKTLTSRVAYLLQHHQYKPWNVLCLTFTIKSSREMRERIARLLGNGIEKRLILGTFHSVCRRYLVTYGHLIGIRKDFGIADSSDTISIIKRIVKRLRLTIDPKKAQSRISSSKSKGISHVELAQQHAKKDVDQQEFAAVFEAYEGQLEQSNLLDYDDLLLRSVDLLRQHPSCVSNVEVVLIDEFQDTNLVQFDLMRLFAARHKRVTAVGDPDQSIYGWRSAEIKNLGRMQRQYPETLVIHLEDNYRSSGAILLAAQELIEQDESRPSKSLLPTHCPGTVPVLRRLPSSESEASWIVTEIFRIMGLTGHLLTYSDFSILLRSAALSRQLETAMGRAGIPYRMVGGQRFFDRVEIKILLNYLRVISQPHNNDALSRIINIPARGVGASTSKRLLEEAEIKKISLWLYIRNATQGCLNTETKVSKAAENGLSSFINIILVSRKKILEGTHLQSPKDLLRFIIKKLDFQAYLEKTHAEDHEARWANVDELVAQAAEYPVVDNRGDVMGQDVDHLPQVEGLDQGMGNAAQEALSKFLANVALATELQREDEDTEGGIFQSQVTISTIHAAKGLEWPVVFIPSAYEGCIPHSRAEDIDEERRLLYVAMTRAQALLYMSYPTTNSQREQTMLSPFLSTKKVGKYLVNKGPALCSNGVNDIARILRRACPIEAEVIEASKYLQSREDDIWPLNGEEDFKPVAAKGSKWDGHSDHDHMAKRRRIQDNESVGSAIGDSSSYMLSTVGIATTMQSSSTFSYQGFVSAAARLQQIKQQKTIIATSDTSKGESMKLSKISNRNSELLQSTQSNLLSLWGTSGKSNTGTDDFAGLDRSREDMGYREAVKTSLATTTQEKSNDSHLAAKKPLSAIPQTLADHRLPVTPRSTRPCLTIDRDEPAKNPYVFLSSSPPPAERLLEAGEAETCKPRQISAMGSLDHSIAATITRPAETFHKTSATQAQATSVGLRRTLGIRRNMNGWAVRSNQGFSIPKIIKPRPPGQ